MSTVLHLRVPVSWCWPAVKLHCTLGIILDRHKCLGFQGLSFLALEASNVSAMCGDSTMGKVGGVLTTWAAGADVLRKC